jgi:hypothetical protein
MKIGSTHLQLVNISHTELKEMFEQLVKPQHYIRDQRRYTRYLHKRDSSSNL